LSFTLGTAAQAAARMQATATIAFFMACFVSIRTDRDVNAEPDGKFGLAAGAKLANDMMGLLGAFMFAALMQMFNTPEPPLRGPHTKLSVAVLLLEAARQDDHFDPVEREMVEKLLTRRFSLTQPEVARLMAAGEARTAHLVQIQGHTHEIAREMSPDERINLIEMLWEVVYADGVLDPEEDHLVRRIAGLIYVTDRDRVLARQRVLARIKHDGH
jgi:uncharacterized tellurite resistance protein B-like protein